MTLVADRPPTSTDRSRARPATGHLDGVLVVGGGYAGVHAAVAAGGGDVPVTVLDPVGTCDFVTRLAAVAGGTAPLRDAAAPLDALVGDVRIGCVASVADGAVELDDGTRLTADAVVVTAGAVPLTPDIPGLERALTLRSSADALDIRSSLDSTERLVVVGGGATGVQLAGAAAAANPTLGVTLVEMTDRLLASMDPPIGRNAARLLEERGVELLLEREVAEVDAAGVVLDDGHRVDGVVVWAAGFDARADELGLDVHEDGRILVTDELLVAGCERTFAAGDVARHLDGDGAPLPMAAQVAVQAGEHAGRNAARLVRGEPLRPAKLTHRGWVLDLGGGRGLAQVGPVHLAGPVLDRIPPLLHLFIDLKNLADVGGLRAVATHRPGAGGSLASAVVGPFVAALRP